MSCLRFLVALQAVKNRSPSQVCWDKSCHRTEIIRRNGYISNTLRRVCIQSYQQTEQPFHVEHVHNRRVRTRWFHSVIEYASKNNVEDILEFSRQRKLNLNRTQQETMTPYKDTYLMQLSRVRVHCWRSEHASKVFKVAVAKVFETSKTGVTPMVNADIR